MKVGVMSDSHGNLTALKKAVDQMGAVDVIIHLGDYVQDALHLETLTKAPVHIVQGNMDQDAIDGSLILETTMGGFKFFATHGHQYGVKNNLDELCHAALGKNADVILFGHTHEAYLYDDGQVLIMNPGSIGASHPGDIESFGLLTITEDGDIKSEIFPIWDQMPDKEDGNND
ncbi:MAG: metallophosphoesterase family protein [Acetobacterium sp.]